MNEFRIGFDRDETLAAFGVPEMEDEGFAYVAQVKNELTGEVREVLISEDDVRDAMFDGVSLCSGECECSIEPDGVCPNGWPSISDVFLRTAP